MAIGFNLPNNYAQPTSAGFGGVDLLSAISKGMQLGAQPRKQSEELLETMLKNKIEGAKAKYAMQSEAANLANTQATTGLNNLKIQELRNSLNQELALQNLLSGGSPNPQYKPNVQIHSLNTNENNNQPGNIVNRPGIQAINDFSDNGMPAEGPGIASSGSAYDTFPGRRKNAPIPTTNQEPSSLQQNISNGMNEPNKNVNLLEQGNPNLYKIDEMYDNYPQFRKQLETKGFKKTQTVKFDPKTGMTSVLTQYPSGKVEAKMLGSMNGDFSPATIANKTQSQKVINAIGNARPIIQKIIDENKKGEIPGQWIGKYFSPDKDASYNSDVIQSSDTLAGALGFPPTNEGLHQAQQTVMRKPRESDAGYGKRLENLLKDMDTREKTAMGVLKSGVSTSNKNSKEKKADPLGIR